MDKIEFTMPLYEIRMSLTGICNHDCVYCGPFSDGKKDNGYKELSLNQIKQLTPLLKKNKLHLQLTGGEPGLRKDLIPIVQTLYKSGIKDIGITTNGSTINPNYAQKLLDAGISDFHIHMPSLNYKAFSKTTKDKRIKVIKNIQDTAIFLKNQNQNIEFNTPVTNINLPTLQSLTDFCFENKINLKLIEEINLLKNQITENQIIQHIEGWFKKKQLNLNETKIDKKYGRIYNFGDFAFRVAPATKGLVDFLNKKQETILYDGRYWIGGNNKNFLFTPSYFIKPKLGTFNDLEKNLNETIQRYNNEKK